jgi:hypothetical protein
VGRGDLSGRTRVAMGTYGWEINHVWTFWEWSRILV